jgi:GAF domain-containing protein
MVGPAVALYDHHENVLRTTSAPVDDSELEDVVFEPGESIAWRVYRQNGFEAIDDVREDPDCMNPNTRFRSELHAAVGSHGVLIAGDTEPDSVTDVERRTMRLMARTMEAALDRVSRVQRLESQEKEVNDRQEEISRVDKLNEQVRGTLQNIISSRSHSQIDSSVCESLIGGAISGVWVSGPNYAEQTLEVQDCSGDVDDYLDMVSFDLNRDSSPPTTSAFATRGSVVESSVGREVQYHEWRTHAVENGISSLVSVPIIYDDVLYGVLTVALSDTAFLQERIVEFLEDLSRVIGYAHYAVTQRNSLTASSEIDLVIDFSSSEHPLVQISRDLNAELTVNGVTNISSERFTAFVEVDSECYVERLQKLSEENTPLENVRLIPDSKTATAQLDVNGTTPLAHVINLGAQLNVAEATSNSLTIDFSLSRDKDAQQFVDRVRNLYTSVSVTAHRESKTSTTPSPAESPIEALTEGQEEILDTAVRTGYFDIPRQTSLSELGSLVGISQNAASERMRRAQSTVLEMLFD